jgi:SRSO17 transposase
MRLPIVQFPQIVVDNLTHFEPYFQSDEQVKHFCEYVTGLMCGDKKTITAINELYLNKNDQSALNKFLTQAKWDEQTLNRRRVELEMTRMLHRPISARAGRLIIDDTLAHHTPCGIEELAYLKDHSLNRYVWAHNLVTSYYVNRTDQFPVDFRLYLQFRRKEWDRLLTELAGQLQQNETLESYRQYLVSLLTYQLRARLFRTKTELAANLVQQAVDWELPFTVVLFDSWFCRQTLVHKIQETGKDWVGGCPKNRKVLVNNQWAQLQQFIPTIPADAYRPIRLNNHLWWTFSQVMPMQALARQRVRIVAVYEDQIDTSRPPIFYATNRRDWEAKRILSTYFDRWPTETFNQDAKGLLGLEAYQLRRLRGIMRHWYLSFVAYSLLGDQAPPGRSRWQVRGRFDSTGQRCRAVADELLGLLIHWIAHQLQEGVSPAMVLLMLLA